MMPSSFDGRRQVVVFDLDDTLYKEIDYLRSAYRAIADDLLRRGLLREDPYWRMIELYGRGENVFETLNRECGIDIPVATYLSLYRTHWPRIALTFGIPALLDELKLRGCGLGMVTDGRSVTQRNKIDALRLHPYFPASAVVISEEFGSSKPADANFVHFHRLYPDARFAYVADNPQKDFLAPNRLGWQTICLRDDGRNIHPQNFDLPAEYLPHAVAETTDQIISYLNI